MPFKLEAVSQSYLSFYHAKQSTKDDFMTPRCCVIYSNLIRLKETCTNPGTFQPVVFFIYAHLLIVQKYLFFFVAFFVFTIITWFVSDLVRGRMGRESCTTSSSRETQVLKWSQKENRLSFIWNNLLCLWLDLKAIFLLFLRWRSPPSRIERKSKTSSNWIITTRIFKRFWIF